MAFNDVLPASLFVTDFQPSLPLHTPRYRIRAEFLTSIADEIICEQNETGTNWSSSGTVDHPSFTRLRNHLAAKGYIHMETGWSNGDRVLREFYLNDVLFEEGARFLCASAMKFTLENSEKHPMKKEEPKMPKYDAELQDWTINKSYYGGLVARGAVYNDSKGRFNDGEYINTSTIMGVDGDILITRNTRYKLV